MTRVILRRADCTICSDPCDFTGNVGGGKVVGYHTGRFKLQR